MAKKTHDIGEQLIWQCCKIITSNLLNNSEVEKIKQAFLSNNFVSRWIADLLKNILSQAILKIQHPNFNSFPIQLDETTDVAYHVFAKHTRKMISCFAKAFIQQQQQQKVYLAKLMEFLRNVISIKACHWRLRRWSSSNA